MPEGFALEDLAITEKKSKKVKVTYYDDDSTVIDMSMANRKGIKKEPPPKRVASPRGSRWKTFWGAVRKMLIPMFIFIIILAVIFLCMYGIGRCSQNQLDNEAAATLAVYDGSH
ncbi:MAG: hypothetical protein LUD72_02485 [Bacteroidales bacterium]|nr:hypothetical protein [Bacteroidales bacterium]